MVIETSFERFFRSVAQLGKRPGLGEGCPLSGFKEKIGGTSLVELACEEELCVRLRAVGYGAAVVDGAGESATFLCVESPFVQKTCLKRGGMGLK